MRLLVLLLFVAPQTLSQTEQEILARITAYARAYNHQLQDFLCIQATRRWSGRSGTGQRWKPLDSYQHEVTYHERRESYRLLKVNGQPPGRQHRLKPGFYQASGQFGSYLQRIFEPAAAAEFQPETTAGGTCVFRYRVQQKNSRLRIQVNQFRDFIAFHGTVQADCETGVVTRVQLVHDLPPEVPAGGEADLRYGPVSVAGREFHLPVHSREIARYHQTLTRIETVFTGYRKYTAGSAITY